ncbi:hypothetical protein [Sinorhizobium meliloti]|uniref:hypothetical protein n=1 Tax=Rhizobium meliloti TaxID=382 RepID=UPI00299EB078|nr:hypothetical protein [Sinorhizobium meliloti]MDW9865070.1 hypothetical protein [Sinorhizobium meliloti]
MCRVDGCYRAPTKFSAMCEYHRNVARVHGDPSQKGITKADLKPYLKVIRDYTSKRSGPRAEAVVQRDWERLVRDAERFLEAIGRGKPHNKHQRKAAEIVVDASGEHHAMDVAVTLMALGYFYADQPRRWASDKGFQFQAVRMFRKLAKSEANYTWTSGGRMIRSSAKRCPQEVTRALWASIEATHFIGYGIQIRQQVEKERAMKQKDRIADLREILGPAAFSTREEA